MKLLSNDRQDVEDFFLKYPWLETYYRNLEINFVEFRNGLEDWVTTRVPHFGNDLSMSEKIRLLDQNGQVVRVVSEVPWYKWWKFWRWFEQASFQETVGQAIVAARSEGARRFVRLVL